MTTTENTHPVKPSSFPNPRWIDQQTSIAHGIADAEQKAERMVELEEARRQLELATAYKRHYRISRNSYPGKCAVTGERVEAGQGWVRKENGRWKTYSNNVDFSQIDY